MGGMLLLGTPLLSSGLAGEEEQEPISGESMDLGETAPELCGSEDCELEDVINDELSSSSCLVVEERDKRTARVFELLLQSEASAPASVPLQGRIVKCEAVAAFVEMHRQLVQKRGLELACPRIVYHWTS